MALSPSAEAFSRRDRDLEDIIYKIIHLLKRIPGRSLFQTSIQQSRGIYPSTCTEERILEDLAIFGDNFEQFFYRFDMVSRETWRDRSLLYFLQIGRLDASVLLKFLESYRNVQDKRDERV